MPRQPLFYGLVLTLLSSAATSQVMSIPSSGFGNIGSHDMGTSSGSVGLGLISSEMMTNEMYGMMVSLQNHGSEQAASASISRLDLKAPGKARHQYEKGYQLLLRKDWAGALEHLASAIHTYPEFVAAHNALGTVYLNSGENEKALDEFSKSAALDDHIPNSFLNLGCAQLALKDYGAAEESFRKASAIAPLDLPLLLALTYGEFANKDYPAVVSTTREIHGRRHQGAALAHFFAAGAWEAQNNLSEAQAEMNLLLQEDQKSASVEQFRRILNELKDQERQRARLKFNPVEKVTYSIGVPIGPSPEVAGRMAQLAFQDLSEKDQIAEAEAEPETICRDCGTIGEEPSPVSRPGGSVRNVGRITTFHASVDEVSILFAATDRGKSVTDLTAAEVGVRDDSEPPTAISNFRNESQLPLRLGLVIDTSNSVTDRFHFEQAAAKRFLEKAVTDQNDLAFVVGVSNSVLLVQDFSSDQALTSHAIDQLAPGGGTALWDAVNFAAQKLSDHLDIGPVARVLVVISDGEDNSSTITLKEAIQKAQRSEVAIYTICTRDFDNDAASAKTGESALRAFSDLTGGAAFVPLSVRRLDKSLSDLQQVIRSRYLISYKPASFRRDGHYRPISITAEKDGHKLRIYARRGYYASTAQRAGRAAGVSQ